MLTQRKSIAYFIVFIWMQRAKEKRAKCQWNRPSVNAVPFYVFRHSTDEHFRIRIDDIFYGATIAHAQFNLVHLVNDLEKVFANSLLVNG